MIKLSCFSFHHLTRATYAFNDGMILNKKIDTHTAKEEKKGQQ
jgi:hypothetical protein